MTINQSIKSIKILLNYFIIFILHLNIRVCANVFVLMCSCVSHARGMGACVEFVASCY